MFSFIDTTVSSDTSDVEGRIEILTKKLAERRVELSRLKREARKQTKQKLRALEANLLNQIKVSVWRENCTRAIETAILKRSRNARFFF